MPRFSYKATDAESRPVSGDIEAEDRRAAMRRLAAMRLTVTSLDIASRAAADSASDDHPALHTPRPLGVHPVAIAFIRGFGELHEGGMPVGDAVRLMASRVTEPALKALCRLVWRDLAEGAPLSRALAKFPAVFDEATVRLVEAAESTGELPPVIRRILESYDRRESLRSRVIGALGYPLLLLGLAGLVLTLFVFVIMPVMERLMASLGGAFPWYVKALMAFSVIAVKGSPFLLLIAAFIVSRIRKARADADTRRAQDAFALRMPLLGPALLHADAARLTDLLSTLLGSGITAANALRLAEKPIANTHLRARFADARRRVHDGAAISLALADTGLLSPDDSDLVAVGEHAGKLPRAFASVAERRRKALDDAVARAVRILSGVFLGAVVTLVFFCLVTVITTVLSVSQSISLHR